MTRSTGALPRLVAIFPALLMLGACSLANHEIPEKPATFDSLETRILELQPFDAIELDADALIEVRQGPAQSVSLSTQADHFENVEVRVENGTLKIDHSKHRGRRHVKLEIVVPALQAMEILSVVDASIEDLHTDSLSFVFDGIGEVSLSGGCRLVNYQISAIGDFNARQFKCDNVIADISGIGETSIYAGETLSLDASGIGSVDVYGNPRVKKMNTSGIGDATFH